jgi:DNA polymerase elongation subunit (family B)
MSESIFSTAIDLSEVPFNEWRSKYIGPGYRSVCYTVDHEKKGRIILFGYDLNGNPKTFICPHKSWIKYVVKYDTQEKDIFGRYIATKWFDTSSARKKYLEAADGLEVMEALRPESEFLQKVFSDVVFEPVFNNQSMRVQSLDIETEISDQFMKPSVADNRINMITIHDSLTDKFYTWSLYHCEIDFKEEPLKNYPKDRFVVFEFNDNEYKMLEHFIDWLDTNRADVLYGWNIKGYDIPYLYTRIGKVLSKKDADKLSPVGKCYVKEVNHDNARANVAAEIEMNIDGVFQSDGLLLYRDKFKIAGSTLDGGYSLDNVGEHEGLGHKIKYNGSLKDLYVKDW